MRAAKNSSNEPICLFFVSKQSESSVTYASIVLLDRFQVMFNGFQINNRKSCLDIVHIKAAYRHLKEKSMDIII